MLRYYWQLLTFLIVGRAPLVPEELTMWSLTTPIRIWNDICTYDGRVFAECYFQDVCDIPLLGRYPIVFALALFLWPIYSLGLALFADKKFWIHWKHSLARPELRLFYPWRKFSNAEIYHTRPDYAAGIYYAFEYTKNAPKYQQLDNKNHFSKACRAHGLPFPKVFTLEETKALGDKIVVVKNPAEDLGQGVHFMKASEVEHLPKNIDWQIQERLQNHPAVAAYLPSEAPLSTLRVITLRDPSKGCSVTHCYFRMGCNFAKIDNFSGGGLVAKIDIHTGIIGEAVKQKELANQQCANRYQTHPEGGEPFAGRTFPFMAETIELCKKAHEALASEAISIGWDVAITPQGPVFIELNFFTGSFQYDQEEADSFKPLANLLIQRLNALAAK